MSAKTIKSALGLLQDDPDHATAWTQLRGEVEGDAGMPAEELGKLLEAARRAHESRRETEAVSRMLSIEAAAASGTPREAELVAELARVLDEDLLDDAGARAAYERLLVLRPGDTRASEALERAEAKRGKWRDLVDRYVQEAAGASDPAFRSSLLVSAAEVTYRYGREAADIAAAGRVTTQVREALELDKKSRRAEMLLERVQREAASWEELARALASYAGEATQKDEKIAAWLRLARVFTKKLGAPDHAADAYDQVLDLAPGHAEASNFLAHHFTTTEQWEHLVALYEGQLSTGVLRGKEEEFCAVLQIAMVHWRMRGKLEAAEP